MLLSICLSLRNNSCLALKTITNMHLKDMPQEMEIIVYDNASMDDTDIKLRPFLWEGRHFLYYKSPKEMPPLVVLQEMLHFAQGKYIWYIDAETELRPRHIQFIQQQLHLYPEIQGLSLEDPFSQLLTPPIDAPKETTPNEVVSAELSSTSPPSTTSHESTIPPHKEEPPPKISKYDLPLFLAERGLDIFLASPHIIQKSIWRTALTDPQAPDTPWQYLPLLGLPKKDISWQFAPPPSFFSTLHKKTPLTLQVIPELFQCVKSHLKKRSDYQIVTSHLCTHTIPQLLHDLEPPAEESLFKFSWQMMLLCPLQPAFWRFVMPILSKKIILKKLSFTNKKQESFKSEK